MSIYNNPNSLFIASSSDRAAVRDDIAQLANIASITSIQQQVGLVEALQSALQNLTAIGSVESSTIVAQSNVILNNVENDEIFTVPIVVDGGNSTINQGSASGAPLNLGNFIQDYQGSLNNLFANDGNLFVTFATFPITDTMSLSSEISQFLNGQPPTVSSSISSGNAATIAAECAAYAKDGY